MKNTTNESGKSAMLMELEKSARGTYRLYKDTGVDLPTRIHVDSIMPLFNLVQREEKLLLQVHYTDPKNNKGVLTMEELQRFYYRIPGNLKEFMELIGIMINSILGRNPSQQT